MGMSCSSLLPEPENLPLSMSQYQQPLLWPLNKLKTEAVSLDDDLDGELQVSRSFSNNDNSVCQTL